MDKKTHWTKLFLTILTCLLYFLNKQTFAIPGFCNASGEWLENISSYKMYQLKQTGSLITLDTVFNHPQCGRLKGEGFAIGNRINFKTEWTDKVSPACSALNEFVGEFTNADCGTLRGDYTMHWVLDGEQYDNTAPLLMYRNLVKIISPAENTVFVISAEPKKPVVVVTAVLKLKRLNDEREVNKLPLCKSLPALSSDQLQSEAIRRYNGGREHRWEPRDDINCQGSWIVKPTLPRGSDEKYVNKVLSCKL